MRLHRNGSGRRQVKAPAGAALSSAAVAYGGVVAVGQDTAQDHGIALRWNDGAAQLKTLPAPADGALVQPAGVDAGARTATMVGSTLRRRRRWGLRRRAGRPALACPGTDATVWRVEATVRVGGS
ncbi:hypothetical protein ACFQ0G_27315 [Streptomyces chiangmaiensis]